MKIAVAGTGYAGLSNAVLLSQHYEVIAVDIVPEKVEKIKTDAEKLKTYLQTYPDLRVNYQKNEHFNLANPDKQRELGEAKTYAINLSGLKDTTDYFQNKEQDASGIVVAPVAYKKTNGTRFYETVSALTYVIDYLRIQ